jgi:hypothetical protein
MAKKLSFITECDMGSVKIYTRQLSAFFANDVGDVPTTVDVYPPGSKSGRIVKLSSKFLGHFTVKSKGTFLSAYDCDDHQIYEFGTGRWFVYLIKEAHLAMIHTDDAVHA